MIWITGNKGMLGQELSREMDEAGTPCSGSDREVSILDPAALKAYESEHKPAWIVNCSAYTAVDKAEDEQSSAYALNRDGAANIAALAAELDIPLVHISTDYVFNGTSSTPLSEDAGVDPQSVYGKSKLAGEEEIKKRCGKYFIIRTAWLYGQYGSNFVYTMLRLMNSKDSINVVNDQHGSPTWTKVLTGLIKTIISSDSNQYGIYHLSGEGQCTWFEFASEIYRLGRENGIITPECSIAPCTSAEFPAKAKRPEYSLLSKEKVKQVFGYHVPDWQDSLTGFMQEYSGINSRVTNWLEHSEYDLETAYAMQESGRYLYVLITVQQSIEKMLKALFEFNGKSVPRIHDLLRLSEGLDLVFGEAEKQLLSELSYYYIASRYNERIKTLSGEIDKERSMIILEKGKDVFLWLKSMIPFA